MFTGAYIELKRMHVLYRLQFTGDNIYIDTHTYICLWYCRIDNSITLKQSTLCNNLGVLNIKLTNTQWILVFDLSV